MKALTVKQPWAWAIIHGGKDVENRSWMPNLGPRGMRIAIHAGKGWDKDASFVVADRAIQLEWPPGYTRGHSRWSSPVARRAHNPKVTSSNLVPATSWT